MLTVSHLFIYPIKSLRSISVSSSIVTDRGLQFDRRWMLVNENNCFLTLREFPKMALLQPMLEDKGMRVHSLEHDTEGIYIPFNQEEKGSVKVTIWNATCKAKRVGANADLWFSKMLGTRCRLVYMPDSSTRPVDTTSGYAPQGKFTSFADAYPFMMIGEASINDLNHKLKEPLSIKRFRPNIVFSGGIPYQEDEIQEFTINQVSFMGLENCARCKIPNVDPETGILNKDKEPLKTLASYRTQNRNINFGRNIVHSGTGFISVGDEIVLAKAK